MNGPDPDPRVALANRALAALERHACMLRAEVAELQSVLATLNGSVAACTAGALREANEHLVLAALEAQAVADQAQRDRDAAARASLRDALTDTPNRAAMFDRLRLAIASAQRRHTHLAVLFIDIDDFKRINDTFGHAVGDSVLQCMARRLESSIRETDTVGRFGGEEFLVLLDDLAATDAVAGIVQNLLEVLAEPTTIAGHRIALSASLGIAFYPDDATDAAALIACADAAMYRAKRRGGGGYEFCNGVGPDTLEATALRAPDTLAAAERGRAARHGDRARNDALQEANGHLVVSALRAQEQEGHAREAQARHLDSMAMAAHELRNPLAPIRLAAHMLDSVRNDLPQFTTLQRIIEDQVTQLARLVDDLVDGARVATGKLHLECTGVDLRQVLDMAVVARRPAMDTRHQQLVLELPPGPIDLQGDRTRLLQVFNNLLDNACKYTPDGGRITLASECVDEACAVSVSDTGVGMPAEVLPEIFDLFAQDRAGNGLRRGGLGIGLALVRELVQAHGGTVVASSEGRGLGSRFVVTLPVRVPAHA